MPFSFPASPTLNQQSTQNGRAYVWDGTTWVLATDVAAHTHSGADITSGTLPDARLSVNVPTLPGMLLSSDHTPSGVVETLSRLHCNGTMLPNSGQVFIAFFTPQVTVTVSQITMLSHTGVSSGLTLARMGLFTTDTSTNAVTLVARTASDTSLFSVASTAYTRSFSTADGFPATYTLQAGTRYGVGMIQVGTTTGQTLNALIQGNLSGLTPRTSCQIFGQSDLGNSTGGTANGNFIYARLS